MPWRNGAVMSLDSANDAASGIRADPRDPLCLVALRQVSIVFSVPSAQFLHGTHTVHLLGTPLT